MPIPDALSEIWEFLHSEVVWLHGRWIVYRQIFGTNPERIALINEAAPTFFSMVQRVLMNDVQLTIVKLADPANTFGKKNLTLETLTKQCQSAGFQNLAGTLAESLSEFRSRCQKIKDRRHKDIAHFDLAVQLSNKAEVLPGPSRQEIEDALAALRKFMNVVYGHFESTTMGYEHFSMLSDGNTLIFRLTEALRYEQLQTAGTIPHEDILQGAYSGV
jgi:hypothetical protein